MAFTLGDIRMTGDLQGSEWLGWHAHTRTPQPLLVCGQPETSPLLYPHNSDADTWETPRGATPLHTGQAGARPRSQQQKETSVF